jgi:hypothetical protein
MTETTTAVDTAAVPKKNDPADAGVDAELVGRLVEQARAAGLQLTGDGGLLQQLTKRVLEAALDGEITDHLGYDKGDPAGKNGQNSRNGSRAKTVLTEVGPVEIEVPRDRDDPSSRRSWRNASARWPTGGRARWPRTSSRCSARRLGRGVPARPRGSVSYPRVPPCSSSRTSRRKARAYSCHPALRRRLPASDI